MNGDKKKLLKKSYKILKITKFGSIKNFYLEKKQLAQSESLESNIIPINW